MKQVKDVYEMVLIRPILRSSTKQQAQKMAASAKAKLKRHERVTQMSVGDASRVYDRIDVALRAVLVEIEDSNGAKLCTGP